MVGIGQRVSSIVCIQLGEQNVSVIQSSGMSIQGLLPYWSEWKDSWGFRSVYCRWEVSTKWGSTVHYRLLPCSSFNEHTHTEMKQDKNTLLLNSSISLNNLVPLETGSWLQLCILLSFLFSMPPFHGDFETWWRSTMELKRTIVRSAKNVSRGNSDTVSLASFPGLPTV